MRPLPSCSALSAVAGALALVAFATLTPATARAQREGFDGAAARQHSKVEQDRALDLNGDGVVDDHEIELAYQNALQQRFIGPDGRVDKEKRRAAQAKRKQLLAESKLLDAEQDLLEKKAKGKKLSAKEEDQLRLAAEIHERDKRERAERAAAKSTQSAAAQKLAKPIIEY
jgi:hypothetical protein